MNEGGTSQNPINKNSTTQIQKLKTFGSCSTKNYM